MAEGASVTSATLVILQDRSIGTACFWFQGRRTRGAQEAAATAASASNATANASIAAAGTSSLASTRSLGPVR